MTISAIYENGMLRLLAPLPLPEHTRVQIEVRYPKPPVSARHQRVREVLLTKGLITPRKGSPASGMLSTEQRSALARRLAVGRPLSELIIEEREERL